MRTAASVLLAAMLGLTCTAASQNAVVGERRHRAAVAFHDGVVILHASSAMELGADGFRQDPFFFYFTGLENTVGAVLAIDGKSGESWLFLPSKPPFLRSGLKPEAEPGTESAKRLNIEHVVDWSELESFLSSRSSQTLLLYYADDGSRFAELPDTLTSATSPGAPTWLQFVKGKWRSYNAKNATDRIESLMEVQDEGEITALRSAAKATIPALMAGMRAIRPGVSQRSVEAVVEDTCWKAGAHGGSFWPWAMSGENAVFPHPFFSMVRYDHLNQTMKPGDLVRLDVGCEWNHYIGDLGRTVPVSGHYSEDQRETWNIYVAAYRAGAKVLREGVTIDEVFEVWRKDLVSHRGDAKSALAQHAIDSWQDRKNVPYWQIHTTNLVAGLPSGPLKSGTTINFEPIASIDGQGFFLEDMYLITPQSAEILTPGVPYSAEEIETAMRGEPR